MTITSLFLLLALCLSNNAHLLSADESRPARSAVPPKRFSASIGGFLGPSYWVRWDGKCIIYESGDTTSSGAPRKQESISIPPERWDRFWKEMDAINVWKWHKRYEDPNTADGTVWHLELTEPGNKPRSVKSVGSNDYPDGFSRFTKAVENLIGGRPFH